MNSRPMKIFARVVQWEFLAGSLLLPKRAIAKKLASRLKRSHAYLGRGHETAE